VVELPVTAIRRNPRQPRRAFDPGALEELATSIASVGVVQPVIVRRVDDGYELIAGERRWRAAQQAGFTVVPAIIRTASDVESLELALIENVVRQQLNPVDEAFALKVLLEDLGVTQEKLAARVGKSRSAIANKIRLLDLPGPVQESLASGELSEGHARALLGLGGRGEQVRMARRIAEKGLSVRQVEDEVRRKGEATETGKPAVASSLPSEVLDQIRDSFFGLLGVMPKVRDRGTGGVIELPFKDGEELARLLDRLR
jgi:ParB family chromosome partitioning protein